MNNQELNSLLQMRNAHFDFKDLAKMIAPTKKDVKRLYKSLTVSNKKSVNYQDFNLFCLATASGLKLEDLKELYKKVLEDYMIEGDYIATDIELVEAFFYMKGIKNIVQLYPKYALIFSEAYSIPHIYDMAYLLGNDPVSLQECVDVLNGLICTTINNLPTMDERNRALVVKVLNIVIFDINNVMGLLEENNKKRIDYEDENIRMRKPSRKGGKNA